MLRLSWEAWACLQGHWHVDASFQLQGEADVTCASHVRMTA